MIWMLEVPSKVYKGSTFFINPALITKIVDDDDYSCRVAFVGDINVKEVTSSSCIVGMTAAELSKLINKEYALIKAMEKASP